MCVLLPISMCVLLHICVQYLPDVVDVFVRPVARDKTLFNLIIKFLKTLRVIKNVRVIEIIKTI